MALIFTAGAIKPLQKKRTQQDNIIKRAAVKGQMMENHVENLRGNVHLLWRISWVSKLAHYPVTLGVRTAKQPTVST